MEWHRGLAKSWVFCYILNRLVFIFQWKRSDVLKGTKHKICQRPSHRFQCKVGLKLLDEGTKLIAATFLKWRLLGITMTTASQTHLEHSPNTCDQTPICSTVYLTCFLFLCHSHQHQGCCRCQHMHHSRPVRFTAACNREGSVSGTSLCSPVP